MSGGFYTMPLKEVIDFQKDPGTGLKLGLASYPIFSEDHRLELNRKIINHYWNREIGMETVSLFVFAVQRRMNEIMPLYNQVYESQLLEFDAISNYKLTTVRNDKTTESETQDSTGTANSTGENKARAVGSTMPQTQLSRNKDYASTGNDNTSSSTSDSNSTGHNATTGETDLNGTATTTGYQGSPADLLLKFRATILNTDMLVVQELEDCFMQVWGMDEELPYDHFFRRPFGIGYRY